MNLIKCTVLVLQSKITVFNVSVSQVGGQKSAVFFFLMRDFYFERLLMLLSDAGEGKHP